MGNIHEIHMKQMRKDRFAEVFLLLVALNLVEFRKQSNKQMH